MDETTSPPAPSSRKWLWIAPGVILLIIVGAVATGALGRGSGFGAAYFAPGVDVDRTMDGSTTYETEQGTVTVGMGGSMPENWPSDAPEAYSGANIVYSGTTNPTTGESGSAVSYTVTASVESVVEYYRARLTAEGWTITATTQAGGMQVIAAEKDTRTIGVYVTSDGQGNTAVTAGVQL